MAAAHPERVVIRSATAQDLPCIFRIYDEQVLHGIATFETEPRTPEQRTLWLSRYDRSRYPVVVAEVDGMAQAWGSLSPWSDRPAYGRTAEDSVYVGNGFRGRGLGSLILTELLSRAHASGICVVIARMTAGNPASIRLHESHGFTPIGTMHRVGEKFGELLDVVLMQRHLDR